LAANITKVKGNTLSGGFIVATKGAAVATTDAFNIGKIFGKLGSGMYNDPSVSGAKGFRQAAFTATTDKNYMLVSILPNDKNASPTGNVNWTAY